MRQFTWALLAFLLLGSGYLIQAGVASDGQPRTEARSPDTPAALIHVSDDQRDKISPKSRFYHGSDHPYTYYNQAMGNCGSRNNKKAISSLEKALKLDPDFVAAHHFRGLMYFELREFESAVSALNQALSLDPKNGHAELYRDRASLCVRGKYHCDFMEGYRCEWKMHLGRAAYLHGLPGPYPKWGVSWPLLK